jgi:hypothetical protein
MMGWLQKIGQGLSMPDGEAQIGLQAKSRKSIKNI